MTGDHYFSGTPGSDLKLRELSVPLAGRTFQLTTANGVFSPERLDQGTQVLLANTPPPPVTGDFLDLGSGWGPIALSLGLLSPDARVWAVDVNERALDLVRRNAEVVGAHNVRAVLPSDVPSDVTFAAIWSNPPIRVGKNELHGMLLEWLPRLMPGADAFLVVKRTLGSDSLQRWLQESLPDDFSVARTATGKGYRVLRVRRHTGGTEAIDVVG
ncbi:class I SAM-dependent methyltransferase [Paramicrobacterium sp. CJ85]|uniref:class I SAM-dependent methyltransferase n=1 Tax=Paramicrobacterium sp. CJ85 TaxID=3445355 RepID=UPI003F6339F2